MKNKIFILIAFSFISFRSVAQQFTKDFKPDPKFAKYCLLFHNYVDGLKEFKALIAEHPDNVTYHYGAGQCYLYLNKDKEKAVEEFEWVVKQKKFDPQAYYFLGWAYHQNNKLDQALSAYAHFKKLVQQDENRISVDDRISMVKNAKKLMELPVHVEIVNMGKYINSEYPEFAPFVPANESQLLYNAQRKSNLGNYPFYDGYYPSDIYASYFKYGSWKKARRLASSINSNNIEKLVGMSSTGGELYYVEEDLEGKKILHLSQKRGRYYRQPKEIYISEEDYDEVSTMTISPNKQYLIFSAHHKKTGIGGKDLFMSYRYPNGHWSPAQLLDSVINTKYDEDFPYFSPDGKYLYFASEGHNSMGGFDLFRAQWSNDSIHIQAIQNLGYPVNSVLDDMTISFSRSGRYAYISAYREDGFGDLDIYRVIFKDVQPEFTVIHGAIFDDYEQPFTQIISRMNDHIDTLNFPINRKYKDLLLKKKDSVAAYKMLATKIPYEKVDVSIEAINLENGKSYGDFRARNDNANYAVILPPGQWKLIFRRKGFENAVIEKIDIPDVDKRPKLKKINVHMRKL